MAQRTQTDRHRPRRHRALAATWDRHAPMLQTFVRRLDVGYDEAITRLRREWEPTGPQEALSIGRSRLTGPEAVDGHDRSQLDVLLGRGPLRPMLPMTLEVVRWSAAFGTWVGLKPAHVVRTDRRYFQEGNDLLDWVAAVITEAPDSKPFTRGRRVR